MMYTTIYRLKDVTRIVIITIIKVKQSQFSSIVSYNYSNF